MTYPPPYSEERIARGEDRRRVASERRQLAVTLYDENGYSQREVGKKLGVSKCRAGQLIRRGRLERHYAEIHGGSDGASL